MLSLKYIKNNKLVLDKKGLKRITLNVESEGILEILPGYEHSILKISGTIKYDDDSITIPPSIAHVYNDVVEVVG